MTDNVTKTPLAVALDHLTRQRTADHLELLGKALPCHVIAVKGQIVTVAFDITGPFTLPNVQLPLATWIYDWIPVQVNDRGVAVAADVYLGGVSGLGGGTADLSRRGNLSGSHYFVPVANSNWQPPGGDGNVRVVQGPDGVRLQDTGGHTILVVDKRGVVTITGDLHVSGAIIAGYGGGDSVGLQTHRHSQSPDSHGDTEQDVNAPTAGT